GCARSNIGIRIFGDNAVGALPYQRNGLAPNTSSADGSRTKLRSDTVVGIVQRYRRPNKGNVNCSADCLTRLIDWTARIGNGRRRERYDDHSIRGAYERLRWGDRSRSFDVDGCYGNGSGS